MWNLRCPGIFVLLSIFLSGPATQAESTLNFPCLSFDPAIFTGVAIVNPSHQDAVVTLTAYGENGQPLLGTGITNPAEIMVPANQQRARLTSEFFGVGPDAATVAWFQATSPTNGLTGFFLFVDDNISKFDGADLPVLAKTIVFNQVRVGAGGSTELNIINPGDSSTVLEVELVDGASSPRVQSLSLAPKGVVRLDVGTFFGVSQSSPASYVRVSSTTEIAGFELVSTPGGDALGLNALDVAGARSTLYFPQMVVMGPWKTELGLVNYSDQVVITTISAYQPDGTLYDTADLQVNPVTRSLGAGESLLESLETLFGFAGANPLEGWL